MQSAQTPLWQSITEWPLTTEANSASARQAIDALAASSADIKTLLDAADVQSLLSGVIAGSPYLSGLMARDPQRVAATLTAPPQDRFAALCAALCTHMATVEALSEAKRSLRIFKSDIALLIGLADLSGAWPVMQVTRALTDAADTAVQCAVAALFRFAAARGQWLPANPHESETSSGYFVLAMGKHGAFELNYSSDIDLIVFFDRDKAAPQISGDAQTFFVRLTRDLVQLMEERTADGYVFRTDLRLRPDAGATQMALSTAAAHGYYETVGQNWERAAMIKARVVAGDITAGTAFLADLKPFIWRKYLDFAAIADIQAMKRQIHAHKGHSEIAVLGHDIKLGRGGIREIEFFAQTQQLIAGGRQPELRCPATLDALGALTARGWVQPTVRDDLEAAYAFLRRLEHRLQMLADEQTHTIPDHPTALEHLAHFAGFASSADLAAALTQTLKTVERHYAGLFESAPNLGSLDSNLVFAGATDDPDTIAALKTMGFTQPSEVLAIVRGWHHGRTPAVRSARARELLTDVQPALIAALGDTTDPDGAIAEFDRFLSQLPAGVQLFSLMKAKPNLLRLIADIMGSAPRLARILSRRRRLLDAVLDARELAAPLTPSELDTAIQFAFAEARRDGSDDTTQSVLDAARVIGGEQSFLTGTKLLTGAISADAAGQAYAMIAERLVSALLDDTRLRFQAEHGKVAGGACVVLAMGKLGSRELTASSDIDLIVVYDFASDCEQSDGAKPLAPSHYYTRLTQRLINAIAAPTAQGVLYEVDMRLRPSGQKGPVATRFSSFEPYQVQEAWTWEQMALTRARVVAGDAELQRNLDAAIARVLSRSRDRSSVAADVRDMRQRIAKEKPPASPWDLKLIPGGLVDLEFIAQHLQLVHAERHREVLNPSTLAAFTALADCGVISSDDHQQLTSAGRLLHQLTHIIRLCLDGPFNPQKAPAGMKALLVQAAGEATFEDLETRLQRETAAVSHLFEKLVS